MSTFQNTRKIRGRLSASFGGPLAPGACRPSSHAGTIRKSFTGELTFMTAAEEARNHINLELVACSTAELHAANCPTTRLTAHPTRKTTQAASPSTW